MKVRAKLHFPLTITKGTRFALREGGKTVAAGVVTEILPEDTILDSGRHKKGKDKIEQAPQPGATDAKKPAETKPADKKAGDKKAGDKKDAPKDAKKDAPKTQSPAKDAPKGQTPPPKPATSKTGSKVPAPHQLLERERLHHLHPQLQEKEKFPHHHQPERLLLLHHHQKRNDL